MRLNNLSESESGFSLVEALIAALVVTVGLMGLASLQSGLFNQQADSRLQTAALHFAQQKIEWLRSGTTLAEFNNRLATGGTDTCDPEALNSECAGLSSVLKRTLEISACPQNVVCRQVKVTVTWQDIAATEQQLSLTTLITPIEPVDTGVALAQDV